MKSCRLGLLLLCPALLCPTVLLAENTVQKLPDIDCDTPVATLREDGYHRIDTTRYSKADAQQLQDFYEKLEGNWTGRQSDEVCIGRGEQSRRAVKYFLLKDVNAHFRHDGLFTFRGEKHRIQDPTASRNARTLSMKPNNRVDFYPASELQTLTILDDDTFMMTKRYRRANALFLHTHAASLLDNNELQTQPEDLILPANGIYHSQLANSHTTTDGREYLRGATFREREDTLFLADDTLLIKTNWYINGYYSGTEITQLFRVR